MNKRILMLVLCCCALCVFLPAETISLQNARDMALQNNKTIQVATIDLASSTRSAEVSIYLPSFSLSTTASAQGSFLDSTQNALVTPSASAGVSFSATTANRYTNESNQIAKQSAQVVYDASVSTVLSNVTTAYWNVVSSKLALEVAKQNLTDAETTLKNNQDAYEGGRATTLVLSQSELNQYDAQLSVESAANTLSEQKRTLAFLIGGDAATIDVEDTLPESGNLKSYDDLLSLMQGSTTYRKSQLSVSSAEVSQKKLTNTKVYPTVSFSASVGVTADYSLNSKTSNAYKGTVTDTSKVSVSVSVPLDHIFTNSSDSVQLENAGRSVDSAKLSLENTITTLQNDIKTYSDTITTAAANITKYQKHLDMAKTQMDLTSDAYEGGRATFSDLTTAKSTYFSSEISLLQQKLNYITALKKLATLLGTERANLLQ